jgi:ABC-type branched-subunit amino acid transport system substrate-binding protein
MKCHSSLRRAAARAWVLAALCVPAASLAEPGVTAQKIVLGMSAPLSGPLATYGVGLEQGLRLGIGQVNAGGGVSGREIELRVLDDAGQPQRTVSNTRALLGAGVLALTGYHGTGGVEAVLPVLDANAVPLVGVASSAEVLREPVRNWVFNLRAGAREEAAAMVTQLDAVGLSEIAVIAQDDALGNAGLEGIRVELARLAIGTTAVARIPADGSGAAVAKAVQAVCARRPRRWSW